MAKPDNVEVDTSAGPKAQTFSLKTALLSSGRTHRVIASTGTPEHAMNIAIKCIAEGGENEFHTHDAEDHTLIVLAGRATFQQPGADPIELARNEGILLPAGAFYKFVAVEGEPLVLVRIGNQYRDRGESSHNSQSPEGSKDNLRGVPIPGSFYE